MRDDIGQLEAYQQLLHGIAPPVSDEEAAALSTLFGPDECFGLAWALVHLIESAPGWPLDDVVGAGESEWIEFLRERANRGVRDA